MQPAFCICRPLHNRFGLALLFFHKQKAKKSDNFNLDKKKICPAELPVIGFNKGILSILGKVTKNIGLEHGVYRKGAENPE